MNNILLLTDLSAVAFNASLYALHLTQTPKQQITLLHAWTGSSDKIPEATLQELEQLKEKLETSAKVHTGTIPHISYVAKKGSLTHCLKQMAAEQPTDLIVMGASDGKALPGYLFGKMVRDIIEIVNKPLLLIPEQVTFGGIKQLFYATDLRYMDLRMLTLLIRMADPLHSAISLLHVCADGLPDLSQSEARSLFSDAVASLTSYPIQLYNTAKDADAEEVVNQMVENHQLSILAVAHRKHHFFKHIFSEDTSANSGIFKQIPLLILPI